MKIEINREECIGLDGNCGSCVQICPEGVLEIVDNKAMVVNIERCTECRACEVACEYSILKCID